MTSKLASSRKHRTKPNEPQWEILLPRWAKKLKTKYDTYKSVRIWMDGVLFGKKTEKISVATQSGRYWGINKFCRWSEKTPDELVKLDPHKIEELLKTYWKEHSEHPASAKNVIDIMKTFFEHNHVVIRIPPMDNDSGEQITRTPSIEEVKEVIRVSDLRGKVIITILLQSSIRVDTLARAKYKHIKEDFKAGRIPMRMDLDEEAKMGKVKVRHRRYGPYLGRDSHYFLKSYFEARRNGTEKIAPETITDESPLIRKKSKAEPVTSSVIRDIVKRMFRRAGYEGITPHALRRAHETALEDAIFEGAVGPAHTPKNWIAHITGHVPREAQGKHYSWPKPEKVMEAYRRAEPFLSVLSPKLAFNKIGSRTGAQNVAAVSVCKRTDRSEPPQLAPKPYKVVMTNRKRQLIEKMEEGWELIKELSNGEYILRKRNGITQVITQ